MKPHYQLYSGNNISQILNDEEDNIDILSVYLHMILLCDYIRAYLRFGLLKVYDIAKLRALPNSETGYEEAPFFTTLPPR